VCYRTAIPGGKRALTDVVAYSPEQLLEEVAGYDKNFGRDT
jgi:hypothetical protein